MSTIGVLSPTMRSKNFDYSVKLKVESSLPNKCCRLAYQSMTTLVKLFKVVVVCEFQIPAVFLELLLFKVKNSCAFRLFDHASKIIKNSKMTIFYENLIARISVLKSLLDYIFYRHYKHLFQLSSQFFQ